MNVLEKKLAILHNKKYCILVGNGTTAIYMALKSQNYINKKILVPNNVCMNVVLAIILSNNIPIYIDIEKNTLGIDSKLLKNFTQIDAIIAVHSYGNICEIEKINSYCQNNKIFLIEDLAVAQGTSIKNKLVGSFGDVSILSFGNGKVLNIGHGGAILTNNKYIFNKLLREKEQLKEFQLSNMKKIEFINQEYTRIYNIDFGKSINKYFDYFQELFFKTDVNFLYKFDKIYFDKLDNELNKIFMYIENRQNNIEYLKNKLIKLNIEDIKILEPKYESIYWRFNIFVESFRNELFIFLLKKGYKVSSWYPPINLLFEKKVLYKTPVSEWIGEHIINIWINEEIDKSYLDCIVNDIEKFYKEN